jgi:hypothetical protein
MRATGTVRTLLLLSIKLLLLSIKHDWPAIVFVLCV